LILSGCIETLGMHIGKLLSRFLVNGGGPTLLCFLANLQDFRILPEKQEEELPGKSERIDTRLI
jgi:hypothetical protein